jgi:hypothetical protein
MKMGDLVSVPLPTQRALSIHLSSGTGKGPTPLAAFDAALMDAGVANHNLLCLSSVIPPNARVVRAKHRTLRSRRERLIQTLWFEALGLAIVSPLFAFCAGVSTGESLVVLIALSIAVMGWSAFHNTAFDRLRPVRPGGAADRGAEAAR